MHIVIGINKPDLKTRTKISEQTEKLLEIDQVKEKVILSLS